MTYNVFSGTLNPTHSLTLTDENIPGGRNATVDTKRTIAAKRNRSVDRRVAPGGTGVRRTTDTGQGSAAVMVA